MMDQMPNFHSSLFGYSREEVAAYLSDLDARRAKAEGRQEAADKTISSLREDVKEKNRLLEQAADEKDRLEAQIAELKQQLTENVQAEISPEEHRRVLEENRSLRQQLEEKERREADFADREKEKASLKAELEELKQKYEATAQLRQECDKLRKQMEELEAQRQTVQDALISAQRMGKIVVNEAQQEAERITCQAREAADQTLEESRQRNEELQASYDRMLLDTSKMKSELIALYRRHLALLAQIPGEGTVPVLEEENLVTVKD